MQFTWIWYILSYNVFIWLRPWFLNTPGTNLPDPQLHLSVLKSDVCLCCLSQSMLLTFPCVLGPKHQTGDFVLLVTFLLSSSSLPQHISPRGFFAPCAQPGWGISWAVTTGYSRPWSGRQKRACGDGSSALVLEEMLQVGEERAAGSWAQSKQGMSNVPVLFLGNAVYSPFQVTLMPRTSGMCSAFASDTWMALPVTPEWLTPHPITSAFSRHLKWWPKILSLHAYFYYRKWSKNPPVLSCF